MKTRPFRAGASGGRTFGKKMAWGPGFGRLSRRLRRATGSRTFPGTPHGPFQLSRRRAPCRGRAAAGDRGGGRDAGLRLFEPPRSTRHYRVFEEALAGLDHLICYAVKANSNLAVLALMGSLGAGMDVVSEGEYRRARAAGVPGERIVFSGVGKTREEMRLALEGGVRQFNVESEPELEALERGGARAGPGGADRDPGQPRRGRADARQDRHRQGGEQVRRADRARARGLCRGGARCRGSRSSASTSISAASSPSSRPTRRPSPRSRS